MVEVLLVSAVIFAISLWYLVKKGIVVKKNIEEVVVLLAGFVAIGSAIIFLLISIIGTIEFCIDYSREKDLFKINSKLYAKEIKYK
jgi:hypothetical protein